MRRFLGLALLLISIQAVIESVKAEPPGLDFNRDIRPILSENCFYCHGQDANKRQADLRLDVREVAVEKGAIVPNDAAASELVERINSHDPLQAHAATEVEPAPVGRPEKAPGAMDQRRGPLLAALGFCRTAAPDLPTVRRGEWVRNPIDRFILRKLEAEGLSPSPEADRPTLIKRLSIDLVGLPPTPEEVDAFVADCRSAGL